MPIVSIKMAEGRPLAVKRKLVKDITDCIVRDLDVRPEWATVLLQEFPREDWATGGVLHRDKFGKGFGKKGTGGKR